MNSHLNIFKTFSKEERTYQLENDLTRAFAICLQEDALFFHEVLKVIFNDDKELELLLSNVETENKLYINIQESSSDIKTYDRIIAVSLSENEMNIESFKNQVHLKKYDPICDIVIILNEIVIIVEAKRDNVDCTAQLFNQAYNIVRNSNNTENFNNIVIPVDLNWKKLMQIASKVYSFQKTVGQVNRLTLDFINLVKGHNPNWLPETPIAALLSTQTTGIHRRVESALNYLDIKSDFKKLTYSDRLGLLFTKPWAQEILFHVAENGNLEITVYAGNTKGQGWHIFSKDVQIAKDLKIEGVYYTVNQRYHIKLTSYQKFFAGLWVDDEAFKKPGLYSTQNYHNYTGRNVKSKGDWNAVEQLFDDYFAPDYNWKEALNWQEKVINTNKTQFDLSFGYELFVVIQFHELKKRDTLSTNLDGLTGLIASIYRSFENDLIK
ncbi:hypothetical protein [Sphingobacterium multivorum]|uniref:hypothetical protein n=1 Tax=Sphingobacterium multivorum TaxID=28454 RepID=UPI00289F8A51|nr:hypothetical protein [Sphingobacterium multivorum]